MNVIVGNKHITSLQSLEIDIIKTVEGEYEAEEIVSQFENFFFQKMILDVTAIKGYKDINNIQKLSLAMDMNKIILFLDDSVETNTPLYLSKLVSMGIYNFTKNLDDIRYMYDHPNSYRDVAHYQQLGTFSNDVSPTASTNSGSGQMLESNQVFTQRVNQRIIGIKNVTKQSGATTLVYMMKKQLARTYQIIAIEVGKRDFMFLPDKDLVSTTDDKLKEVLSKHSGAEVIIIDMNDSSTAELVCNEIIYLIEPSTIKLNRLLITNKKTIDQLRGKKVVLSQSVLTTSEVSQFEYEANLSVFYNMPPLDERKDSEPALDQFLVKLGLTRQSISGSDRKGGLRGLFDR